MALGGLPALAAGQPVGSEFQINTYTTHNQSTKTNTHLVAADASGNFVVVWDSYSQDGSGSGIFGQRYDNAGGALGREFRVNSYATLYQLYRSAAAAADGDFVVVWESDPQDGSGWGVFGQRYDSAGVAQGDEFQINSFTTGFQSSRSVWATGTNQFVVAWESTGQDGSGSGVFGQRFHFPSVTVETPNTNVKWRIGSLQRIKWTHNLGRNSAFRIELDRPRRERGP